MKKKKILIGLGIVAVAGTAFFLYKGSQANASSKEPAVELYKVAKQTPLHLKGQVKALDTQTVLLSADKGPVKTIHVKAGDHVTKDTVLVTYEWGEKIKAVQDSVVASIDNDAKNDVTKPLMTLKSIASEIKGIVTEYDKEKLSVNQDISIEYVNQDKTVQGKITGISEVNNEPEKDQSGASASAIVNYDFTAQPNEAIPVGYSVEILIPRNEIHLPTQSVVTKDGESYVFTVSKGKARKQTITAQQTKGYYLLQDGIKEGTKIVNNAKKIKDGMDVSVE